MKIITKKVVWVFPEELHRLVKAEAAKLGLTANDYAIKVFTEKLKTE